MPIVEYEIDLTTGELKAHVQGIQGPACEQVLKTLEALLGKATEAKSTAEYHQAPPQQQIRRQGR